MDKLLLHPTTEHQLIALTQAEPHAILISGAEGTGKRAIANRFITQIFGPNQKPNNPYFLHISTANSGVGIEEVRKIRDFLGRKTAGSSNIRRIILISDAHTMNSEAQNALLKTLEEPPADTMVILSADDPTALKQTIRSRTQQLIVLPVSQYSSEEYFTKAGYDKPSIQAAYYMSDGRVGLLKAILEGSGDHELVTAIADAKELLKMPAYEKLLKVDKLTKEKEQLALLLQGLERVVISGLRQAADKNNASAVRRFYKLGQTIQAAQDALTKNANAKLVLTELFLNM